MERKRISSDSDSCVQVAVQALAGWRHVVSRLSDLLDDGRQGSELLAWYEQLVEDPAFASDPPVLALDTLVDELARARLTHEQLKELAQARWALLVAEKLVGYRRCEGSSHKRPETSRTALQLEGLLFEATRHINSADPYDAVRVRAEASRRVHDADLADLGESIRRRRAQTDPISSRPVV